MKWKTLLTLLMTTLIISDLTIEISYSEVDMDDPQAVSKAYRALYNVYEDLSKEYRAFYTKHKKLLSEYESLTISFRTNLSLLKTAEETSRRQAGTIQNLEGEITTLFALINDLRRKKNPLLNFTLDGFVGYSGQFLVYGVLSWMPFQKGWFRAGLFGEIGYVFLEDFGYRCGIKFAVSLFGN